MSKETRSVVVEITKFAHHPNADKLDITQVNGNYPCIFQRDNFKPGDKAVYIPVDSVVPDLPSFAFLEGHNRIKARRLRGIFSMGLLIPLKELIDEDVPVGTDVTDRIGITKYEPPIDKIFWKQGEAASDPGCAPVFEVEGLRMFPTAFANKQVSITEKIHGTNVRVVYHDGELHVGSHRTWLKKGPNTWWNVVQNYHLEELLAKDSEYVLYGEIYGPKIQDLDYTAKTPQIVFYDVMLKSTQTFASPEQFRKVMDGFELPTVPVLFEGAWSENLLSLAEGPTIFGNAAHVREGIVIRPTKEEFSPELGGRLILKFCGEGYYTRKEKK